MSVLDRIQLIRNVGKFDSVNAGSQLPLSKLTVMYAENGRGKTTLAAILRSLSDGNPELILERKRLTAANPPQVVLNANGVQYQFQDGAWSSTLPDIAIFDDAFVAQNVCSGIDIQTEHRQNLHELILGAQGIALPSARSRLNLAPQHPLQFANPGQIRRFFANSTPTCATTMPPIGHHAPPPGAMVKVKPCRCCATLTPFARGRALGASAPREMSLVSPREMTQWLPPSSTHATFSASPSLSQPKRHK
jgi:hypothetical protein